MSKQFFKKLIDDYKGEESGLADYLAAAMENIENIGRDMGVYHRNCRDEEERHKTARNTLNAELKAIQVKCRHLASTYYGDPAGGSDSWTQCNYCEKSI